MAVVMVVDDDAETRATLKRFLERRGHHVSCAGHGKEALEMMSAQQPDEVVLDARMPLVDGIEFLEVLRCYLRWQNLPVIMLTGYPDGPHIKRATELGVQKTFLKGKFELEELAQYIESMTPLPPGTQPGNHHHWWFRERYLKI
jgi:CheY-like chemotaxis protein